MPLHAAELRQRITIQKPVYSQNTETGERMTTWANFAVDVPANVSPLSAREFIAAAATQSKVSARIQIRYRPGLNAGMRILHRDAVMNIEGVIPDDESGLEWLTLPVSSGVSQGQ